MTIVTRTRTVHSVAPTATYFYGVNDKNQTVAVAAADLRGAFVPTGADPTGAADSTTAIQAAIDEAYEAGGGEVFLPVGTYLISATLVIPQRVTLVGVGGAFVNQYTTNYADAKGTVIFMAAGSDVDALLFRCRLTNNGGILEETTLGGRNTDARHFGGARNLVVWGNRSATATPSAVDLNSAGCGIKVAGSRYVELENVASMYCAEDGVKAESYDYGLGAVTCNNLIWRKVSALSNAGNGFDLAGGDNNFAQLQSGYNADNGFLIGLANSSLSACYSWNNWGDGFLFDGASSGSTVVSGCRAYDNSGNGFKLGEAGQVSLVGCQGLENGRTTNGRPTPPADTERCNFHVAANTQGAVLADCHAISSTALYAHYGFYIDNTTYQVRMDGCYSSNHITSNYTVTDDSKVLMHFTPAHGIDGAEHPGFKAGGYINLNNNDLYGAKIFGFNTWQSVSTVTANELPVTASIVAMSCTGAQTVTDITYAGSAPLVFLIVRNSSADTVTFTHNTAKIRCANATSVVLGQYEAVMFVEAASNVWQQVGVAA